MRKRLAWIAAWLKDVVTQDRCSSCQRTARKPNARLHLKANPILKRRIYDGVRWLDICSECNSATRAGSRGRGWRR